MIKIVAIMILTLINTPKLEAQFKVQEIEANEYCCYVYVTDLERSRNFIFELYENIQDGQISMKVFIEDGGTIIYCDDLIPFLSRCITDQNNDMTEPELDELIEDLYKQMDEM